MTFVLNRGRKCTFSPGLDSWTEEEVTLRVQTQPFASGGMREAFKCSLMLGSTSEVDAVIKRLQPQIGLPSEVCRGEAICQLLAARYAHAFNAVCRAKGLPHEVHVVPVALLQLEGTSELLTLEQFIPGPYRKYSDNMGNISPDGNEVDVAFSYFTYIASGKTLVVCDLQGVGNIYTDPQIHTVTAAPLGLGNMGEQGIASYLCGHRHNELCERLGLPAPPEAACAMPAIDCQLQGGLFDGLKLGLPPAQFACVNDRQLRGGLLNGLKLGFPPAQVAGYLPTISCLGGNVAGAASGALDINAAFELRRCHTLRGGLLHGLILGLEA